MSDTALALEKCHATFKFCANTGSCREIPGGMKTQGAVFLGLVPLQPPSKLEDLNGKDFQGMDVFLFRPLAAGTALAPYTYARGSKLDKKTLQAQNRTGLPLFYWQDAQCTTLTIHSWKKSGFNRDKRSEDVCFDYGGGDTYTIWITPQEFEEKKYEDMTMVGMYIDGKKPAFEIGDMDLVRICFMPKSLDAFSKEKKTCFSYKGIGACTRSLISYISWLEDGKLVPSSLQDAKKKAETTVNEAKHEWAHHLSFRGAIPDASAGTVAFYERNVGPETSFVYIPGAEGDKRQFVRMSVRGKGGPGYDIDLPVSKVLMYTNAKNINNALKFLRLACNMSAISVFVMHNDYWGTQNTNVSGACGMTPFRGIAIIDAKKILRPILQCDVDKFVAEFEPTIHCALKKAKITNIKTGVKIFTPKTGVDLEDGEVADEEEVELFMETLVEPRKVEETVDNTTGDISTKPLKDLLNVRYASEFRLSPHGDRAMEKAHVLSFYYKTRDGEKKAIMNLDYDASQEMYTSAFVGSMTGKKHTWHEVEPSALDNDSDEDEVREENKKDNISEGKKESEIPEEKADDNKKENKKEDDKKEEKKDDKKEDKRDKKKTKKLALDVA